MSVSSNSPVVDASLIQLFDEFYISDHKNFPLKIPEIEKQLGYTFQRKDHLLHAFTHSTYANEHYDIKDHNERLEFLGDAVLGLIVTELIYKKHPDMREGELTQILSKIVDDEGCSKYMEILKLKKYLLVGNGERSNKRRGLQSMLANLFEAVIGAIYLDGGLEAAKEFFLKNFGDHIEGEKIALRRNWKGELQEIFQDCFQDKPTYNLISEEGPDHDKTYTYTILLEEEPLGKGEGKSKKEAQIATAKSVLLMLEEKVK